MKKGDKPALVGIVPRKELWPIIRKERWYHIPVAAAPRNVRRVHYVAFYFPAVFGEELQYRVWHYAPVKGIKIVRRIELFPDEPHHSMANQEYYQILLTQIRKLPHPIPSQRWRRIVHIPSTYDKLTRAREINDLYETSPLEDMMYKALRNEEIQPERQYYVKVGAKNYCLDFCVFCRGQNIDIECDGERYHTLPDALVRDRERNNELVSQGWSVLRFSGTQIRENLLDCLKLIKKTIRTNAGPPGTP